jgi:hypothetical protein
MQPSSSRLYLYISIPGAFPGSAAGLKSILSKGIPGVSVVRIGGTGIGLESD